MRMSISGKIRAFLSHSLGRLSEGEAVDNKTLAEAESYDDGADTRPVIRFGIIVILVTFVGFGGWAAFAPMSQGAVASGKIVVENQLKSVQHLEGGIVKALMVHDGDHVKKGQTLIELDDTRIRANVQIYEGQYLAAKAQEARLEAERDGKETIEYPTDILAHQDEPEIAKVLGSQKDLFQARREALKGEQSILIKRITQLQELVSGLKAQTRAKDQQLKLLGEEIGGLRKLYARGHASKQRLLALEREQSKIAGERGKNLADIASANLRIGETRLQVIQNEKDFRQKVVDELSKAQEEVASVQERLIAARDVLAHTSLKAPVSGVVVGLEAHTVGAVIPPGKTIMQIVPQNQRLIVQARAKAQDIDVLTIGAPAEVRILPFKQRLLPILMARVISISADSLEDERTGIPYYKVNAEIPEDEMAKLNGQILVPGMPADVIVQAGEYTALQYFLGPLSDSLARAFND